MTPDLSTLAGRLTTPMRRALTAAANGRLNLTDRITDPNDPSGKRTRLKTPAGTRDALLRHKLVEPRPGTSFHRATPHGRAVLNAPLPHETLLLGNKTGYTSKSWLAINATDGLEPEPEAINTEHLHPHWTTDAQTRHDRVTPNKPAARRIRDLRRAA